MARGGQGPEGLGARGEMKIKHLPFGKHNKETGRHKEGNLIGELQPMLGEKEDRSQSGAHWHKREREELTLERQTHSDARVREQIKIYEQPGATGFSDRIGEPSYSTKQGTTRGMEENSTTWQER
jgi:hypothetical protein